jgi:hypothetical protein
MKNMEFVKKLKVGDAVWVLYRNDQEPKIWPVVSVGNKYLSVRWGNKIVKFHKDTGLEKCDDSYPFYELYESRESYEEEMKRNSLMAHICLKTYISGLQELSTSELETIADIFEKYERN